MESINTIAPPTKQKRLPKKIRALKLLMTRSLIQPEAHDLYGETCLHTVISQLSNDHGLTFERKPEEYGIHKARFTRYTLAESATAQASQLVEHYENGGRA